MGQNSLFYLTLLILLTGCSSSVKSKQELLNWINNKDNGYSQVKVIGAVKYTCKILPASYLAWRDIEVDDSLEMTDFNQVKQQYDSSLILLFGLAPADKNAEWDVMKTDVSSYGEFKEKVEKMNFWMKKSFSVTLGKDKFSYHPVITRMENDYGLTKGRNMMIVFDLDGKVQSDIFADKFQLKFKDDIFQGGNMVFLFNQMSSVPVIKNKHLKR